MAYCHLVATVFMVGLIWFVQVVHYPLFNRISGDASIQYAAEHQRRTAWVVGLPMLVEGITTLWLFFDPINGRLLPLLGGLALLKIHLSTVFLQVPLHKKLSLPPFLLPAPFKMESAGISAGSHVGFATSFLHCGGIWQQKSLGNLTHSMFSQLHMLQGDLLHLTFYQHAQQICRSEQRKNKE